MRRAIAIGTALAVLLPACGESDEPLPAACSDGPDPVLRALQDAPGDVALADGTLLSDCVARASDDAELQMVGLALTPVADRLNARATPQAAVRLGFLVGAVRRGSARSNGVHAELVRRLESRVAFDDPRLLAAAQRGAAAGEVRG